MGFGDRLAIFLKSSSERKRTTNRAARYHNAFRRGKSDSNGLYEAARSSSCTREDANGYKEYTKHDNGFFAILGSVSGNSAAHIILEHKKEIGYRTVERIVIFGKKDEDEDGHKDEDEYGKAKSFMILLSACRERPTEVTRSSPGILDWMQRNLRSLIETLHSE